MGRVASRRGRQASERQYACPGTPAGSTGDPALHRFTVTLDMPQSTCPCSSSTPRRPREQRRRVAAARAGRLAQDGGEGATCGGPHAGSVGPADPQGHGMCRGSTGGPRIMKRNRPWRAAPPRGRPHLGRGRQQTWLLSVDSGGPPDRPAPSASRINRWAWAGLRRPWSCTRP